MELVSHVRIQRRDAVDLGKTCQRFDENKLNHFLVWQYDWNRIWEALLPAVITQILDDASGEVTHLIIRLDSDSGKVAARNDLIPPNEHLQCALIEMAINQTFEPHIHPSRVSQPQTLNTQEAWIVLTGQIEATLFDVFGKVVATSVLREGDLCITLRGGHNYKSLTSGSIVYEFKTGPYLGPEIDKVPVSAITPREG